MAFNCRQLTLVAIDGKKRATDCANTEGIFRLIPLLNAVDATENVIYILKQ